MVFESELEIEQKLVYSLGVFDLCICFELNKQGDLTRGEKAEARRESIAVLTANKDDATGYPKRKSPF